MTEHDPAEDIEDVMSVVREREGMNDCVFVDDQEHEDERDGG